MFRPRIVSAPSTLWSFGSEALEREELTMFDDAVQAAINDQIKVELHSAYTYLSMSAYFEAINLPGFATWFLHQSQEEVKHAMKFFTFMHDRGGRVMLQTLDQPEVDFKSPLVAFEAALEHERKVTASIHRLYDLATKHADYPAQVMLNWFVEEQVEEEKTAADIVAKLQLADGNTGALLMLDQQLGARNDSHHH
jgi:ferritin